MHGTYLRKVLQMVLTKSKVAKAVIENLLHLSLVLHATTRIIEEAFVKGYSRILMPPRRVEYYINGQLFAANVYHGNKTKPPFCFEGL